MDGERTYPRGLRQLPNPYWLPAFVDAAADEVEMLADVGLGAFDEKMVVQGTVTLLCRAIDMFADEDLRFDEALGIETDHATDAALGHDPATYWPTSSPRGRAWCRVWSLNRNLSRSKDLASLRNHMLSLERELIEPIRQAYSTTVAVDPRVGGYEKESLARRIALQRLGELVRRHGSFGIDWPAFDGQHSWSELISSRAPGYRLAIVRATRRLASETLAQAVAKAGSLEQIGDALERSTLLPDELWKHTVFIQQAPANATDFSNLTREREVPKNRDSPALRFKRALSTYRYELFDPEESGIPVTGAALLLMILESETAPRHEGRCRVLRVRHGAGEEAWVSYGILIERRGIFTIGSGWIIFPKVGAEFRGDSDSDEPYARVEHELAARSGRVEIIPLEMPLRTFRQLLSANHEYRRTRTLLQERRGKLAGRLLEHLVADSFRERGYRVTLSFKNGQEIGKHEIDVVAFHDERKECLVVETTVDGDDAEGLFVEVDQKARLMEASNPGFAVRGVVVMPASERDRLRSAFAVRRGIPPQRSGRNATLWTLEDDIMPHVPPKHRRADVVSLFQPLPFDSMARTDDE